MDPLEVRIKILDYGGGSCIHPKIEPEWSRLCIKLGKRLRPTLGQLG
jgi:hypothetical protein